MSKRNPRPRINEKNARGLLLMVALLADERFYLDLSEDEIQDLEAGLKYAKDLAEWKQRGNY